MNFKPDLRSIPVSSIGDQEQKADFDLKLYLQVFYFVAIFACLGLGLLPLDRWLQRSSGSGFSPWNLSWLQAALLLAALGLAVYAIALRSMKVGSLDMAFLHLFIGLLIVHTSCLLIQFWKYVTYRVPITWSENVAFLCAAQPDGMLGLYSISKLSQPPFPIAMYGPLFYAVQKFLFLFSGRSPLVGRYVSMVAVLAMAILLAFALWGAKEKLWALTTSLLFLSIFHILAWRSGSLLKPEFLAASFSLAGLLVYVNRGLLVERKKWILWSSLLCGLALLTKLSVLAGFAAIVIHLLWTRRYKECASFVLLVFFWVFGTYALLWWPTGGGIWFMTVRANAVKFTPIKILQFGLGQYMVSPFVVMALAGSVVFLIWRTASRSIETAVSLYFLIAFCWFMISAGRPGSSYSYFLEAAVSGSLLIGMLIYKYAEANNWAPFRLALAVLVVSMVAPLVPQFGMAATVYDDEKERAQIVSVLSDLKTDQDEYILSDPYYSMYVIQAEHRLLVNDSHLYTAMIDSNIVSIESLMEPLRRRKVPYVVLQDTPDWHSSLAYGAHYWPVGVLDYLKQNYTCTTIMQRKADGRYLVICKQN